MGVKKDTAHAPAAAMADRIAAASPLPYGEAIQRSFGRHDVSGIQAHVGGDAGRAARGIGADAYATGTQVHFAGTPSLHTAAHEAAHVVQQRAGVQLGAAAQQKVAALADEIAHSSAPPHAGRVVVTPPSQPATPSQSLGAAYATIKNIAKIEQTPPGAAQSAAAASAAAPSAPASE